MFMDALLLVSDAQAVTATAVSTSSIDLSATDVQRQVGTGEPIGFGLTVDVAADHTTGNETYQVDLVSDSDPALGSPTVIASYVLLYSQLTAGAKFFFPLPMGFPAERYIGLQYTVGGTTPTVTVTAGLTLQSMFSKEPVAYPRAYTP